MGTPSAQHVLGAQPQRSALIQPPWATTMTQGAAASARRTADTQRHQAPHARTRKARSDSPPPGAASAKSAHQASTASCGTSDHARPSQPPKSISISPGSVRTRQPQRRRWRATAAQRCSGEQCTVGRLAWVRPCRRASCRMRWASRLALRPHTGRSVWPMQRPAAPRATGWRHARRPIASPCTGCAGLNPPGGSRSAMPAAPPLPPVADWPPGCRR